jgi:hypothetical protein
MNYDLAMMALEGLGRSPLTVQAGEHSVEIRASKAAFKELARLCLLLGGEESASGDEFELKSPLHLAAESPTLRLRRF